MEVTTIKSNEKQYFHSAKNIKFLPTLLKSSNPFRGYCFYCGE